MLGFSPSLTPLSMFFLFKNFEWFLSFVFLSTILSISFFFSRSRSKNLKVKLFVYFGSGVSDVGRQKTNELNHLLLVIVIWWNSFIFFFRSKLCQTFCLPRKHPLRQQSFATKHRQRKIENIENFLLAKDLAKNKLLR